MLAEPSRLGDTIWTPRSVDWLASALRFFDSSKKADAKSSKTVVDKAVQAL